MADVHDKATRSYNMSRIRNKDTKPEILVRKFLFANGFRYRLNDKKLPGKPDIVLPKFKTVLFVHGCFWHRHPGCKRATTPASNRDYWDKKFARTVARDAKNERELADMGWRVLVVWECELKDMDALEGKLTSFLPVS